MVQFQKGLVSIIVPVFNRENLLPETLISILEQTYSHWECIIVDDGSTDSSVSVAKQFCRNDDRFKVYRRPWYKKKGANTCRNYGFELSNGEFIQWFDSDDIMLTEMLQKKVSMFHLYNPDIVVCGACFFQEKQEINLNEYTVSLEPKTNNPAFEYFAGNFWFGTPQAMISRIVLSKLPYTFNNKLNRNQETEFYVRLLLNNFKFHYLNQALILVRVHNFSISGNYCSFSESKRLELDLDAYVSIFLEFNKRKKINRELQIFFSEYFLRSFKKITHNRYVTIKIFLFCFFFNLFPSRKLSLKILIYRILRNV